LVGPHVNNPSPIFGFDVVGSEKTGKISGAFVDHSPTLYDKRWHYTRWSSSRILPEWATVFSDDFLAIRPNENEYDQLFDFAYGAFAHYFDILNDSSPATDDKVAALIREKQENYCKMQASNPRTYAALKHQLGPERAQHFMENMFSSDCGIIVTSSLRETLPMKAHAYFQNRNGDVKRVAEITIPNCLDTGAALESVYCLLQNIRGSWSMGPDFEGCAERQGLQNLDYSPSVKFVGEYFETEDGLKLGERSMMNGDLITFDGKTYEVAPFGFDEYKEAV